MADNKPFGADFWENAANKLLQTGIDVLLHKGAQGDTEGSGNLVQPTTMGSGLTDKIPFILGGIAVVGIALILWKR